MAVRTYSRPASSTTPARATWIVNSRPSGANHHRLGHAAQDGSRSRDTDRSQENRYQAGSEQHRFDAHRCGHQEGGFDRSARQKGSWQDRRCHHDRAGQEGTG